MIHLINGVFTAGALIWPYVTARFAFLIEVNFSTATIQFLFCGLYCFIVYELI